MKRVSGQILLWWSKEMKVYGNTVNGTTTDSAETFLELTCKEKSW